MVHARFSGWSKVSHRLRRKKNDGPRKRKPPFDWHLIFPFVTLALVLSAVPLLGAIGRASFFDQGGVRASGSFTLCASQYQANCVIDGDTIHYNGTRIRLADIDAPEMHEPRCASELALGEAATHRLLELLNTGPFVLRRLAAAMWTSMAESCECSNEMANPLVAFWSVNISPGNGTVHGIPGAPETCRTVLVLHMIRLSNSGCQAKGTREVPPDPPLPDLDAQEAIPTFP